MITLISHKLLENSNTSSSRIYHNTYIHRSNQPTPPSNPISPSESQNPIKLRLQTIIKQNHPRQFSGKISGQSRPPDPPVGVEREKTAGSSCASEGLTVHYQRPSSRKPILPTELRANSRKDRGNRFSPLRIVSRVPSRPSGADASLRGKHRFPLIPIFDEHVPGGGACLTDPPCVPCASLVASGPRDRPVSRCKRSCRIEFALLMIVSFVVNKSG